MRSFFYRKLMSQTGLGSFDGAKPHKDEASTDLAPSPHGSDSTFARLCLTVSPVLAYRLPGAKVNSASMNVKSATQNYKSATQNVKSASQI